MRAYSKNRYTYVLYWLWKKMYMLWLEMKVCDIPPENLRGTGMSTQRWGSPHPPRHGDHHRCRHYNSSSTLPRLHSAHAGVREIVICTRAARNLCMNKFISVRGPTLQPSISDQERSRETELGGGQ